MENFIMGPDGNQYEKHAGKVWISKQDVSDDRQRIIVATLDENSDELQVLDSKIDGVAAGLCEYEVVRKILESSGWTDHSINLLLAEPDEIVTCSICRHNFYEGDVNLVDYTHDVCVNCEPEYNEKKYR